MRLHRRHGLGAQQLTRGLPLAAPLVRADGGIVTDGRWPKAPPGHGAWHLECGVPQAASLDTLTAAALQAVMSGSRHDPVMGRSRSSAACHYWGSFTYAPTAASRAM
eukprot:14912989-Alexandrium_andersonii.AAC.1